MNNLYLKRTFFHSSKTLFFDKFLKPVIEASQKREHVVEQLIRPVGLPQPPNSRIQYSKGNSFRDLFDEEKTRRRTKELTLEMSKSGMYDVYTFRKTNGKLFISPKSYWRDDKSLYFPHIVGRSLKKGESKQISIEDKMRGKLNIVRLFSNDIGKKLSSQFFKEPYTLESLSNTPFAKNNTQLIEITWVENGIKSLITKLSFSKLRSNMSEQRQRNYFFAYKDQLPFIIRDQLNINNILTGYILLVDQNLKIRWMACGGVSNLHTEERDTMWKCIRSLQKEMEKINDSNQNKN